MLFYRDIYDQQEPYKDIEWLTWLLMQEAKKVFPNYNNLYPRNRPISSVPPLIFKSDLDVP
jgi:hypothetical protein